MWYIQVMISINIPIFTCVAETLAALRILLRSEYLTIIRTLYAAYIIICRAQIWSLVFSSAIFSKLLYVYTKIFCIIKYFWLIQDLINAKLYNFIKLNIETSSYTYMGYSMSIFKSFVLCCFRMTPFHFVYDC